MKINIKTTNLDLLPGIKEYTLQKINSLDSVLKRYGPCLANVELARISQHHQAGNVFKAEIQLGVPNKVLYAVSQESDLKIAINKAKEELRRQIIKDKSMKESRLRLAAKSKRR